MFVRTLSTILLAAGLLLSANSAIADNCCPPPICEVGCFPYTKGTWTLGAQVGPDFTYYGDRGLDLSFSPLFPVGFPPIARRHPSFHDQFKLPVIWGGYIGYMIRNSVEVFLEGNYATASSKTFTFTGLNGAPVNNKLQRYQYYDFYLGVRYYPFTCGCAAPFIGIKAGGAHRNRVKNHQTTVGYAGFPIITDTIYYESGTVGSAGFQLGVNFGVTDCVSIVLKGEVVVTGCWDSVFTNIPIPTLPGSTGPIVTYPATIGLRVNW